MLNNSSTAAPRKNSERKDRAPEDAATAARSVYVSDLAWATTAEGLIAHFAQVGRVQNANIMQKIRSGKSVSLGCGIVEFSTAEEAAHAMNVMTGTELDGRVIKCREDRSSADREAAYSAANGGDAAVAAEKPRRQRPLPGAAATSTPAAEAARVLEPTKVFVTALAWATTSEGLAAECARVGKVVAAEVLTTRKGRSLGHGVVEYASAQAATRAIAELSGRELDGRAIVVRAYYQN